mmetsp:Transcript_19421/g.47975  ORF Transcript_19421/g.47975 Transcript_19421/m.47975 type:complete len:121 (+) Transcript_19421:130-492(+)
MKFSTIVLFLASVAAVDAFTPTARHNQIRTSLAVSQSAPSDPELADAIADVRAAAKAFGDETEHFANVWIDRMLSGEREGVEAGLLEECVIDDDAEKCQKFEDALKKLDALLGVGAGEQF